jgi:hypothetical protein
MEREHPLCVRRRFGQSIGDFGILTPTLAYAVRASIAPHSRLERSARITTGSIAGTTF